MFARTLLFLLITLVGAPGAVAKEAPLRGLANPSLAFGVSLLRDWESAKPFIDHVRFMRPFVFEAKKGGNIKRKDLPKGVFDAHGWVRRIPKNAKFAVTLWHWDPKDVSSAQHKGEYVLTYEGEGELALKLDVSDVRKSPGRIEFSNRSGGPVMLRILSTDPKGTGDYIRNITLMRKEHVALHKAGALFNPAWLASVADARQIRFLNWMQTNSSGQKTWDQRPKVGDASWAQFHGVPVEVLVRLANEIGADPWFTMPHKADDGYNRAFATYVRDNLDPRLKAHVEYSNELWNRGFRQTKELAAEAKRAGRGVTLDQIVAQRSFEVMEIWREVFGGEADQRLVRVLGSWQARPDWTEQLLSHRVEPAAGGTRRPVADGFDAVAVATYFGGGKAIAPRMHDLWLSGAARSGGLRDILEDRKLQGSPAWMATRLRGHADLAARHGLKLLSYEGGQHLHTNRIHQLGGWKFINAVVDFIYSDEMAGVYEDVWRAWREIGDGPFMQFVAVQKSSRGGSWGLQRYPGEASPAWRTLSRLNAATPGWWGDPGGAQYQQGHLDGRGGLIGTAEEDYLIGGDGDDVFYPSTGSDGVYGGAGRDAVVLPGPRAAYSIDRDAGRVNVRRGADAKSLTAIEELRFSDGTVLSLTD